MISGNLFLTIQNCLLFFLLISANQPALAQSSLTPRVEEQITWLDPHFQWIDSLACEYKLEKPRVLAVVGPEMVRYSMVSNLLETTALELAYVQGGPAAADFSIGRFQMKPSFIEQLDSIAESDYACEPWASRFFYSAEDKSQRRTRLARLKDFTWQVHYAMLFYRILDDRFPKAAFTSQSEQLKFFAAAYNYGFLASVKEINRWAEVPAFPHGRKFRNQHPYAEWANAFYNSLIRQGW